MKNTFHLLFQILMLFSFLTILVIDHFEQITIPLAYPLIVIVFFVIAAAVTGDMQKQTHPRTKFIRNFLFTIIIMLFLFLLALLGGQSQSGIGFANPIVWGLAIVTLFYSYLNYTRAMKENK